jgi:enamine deaminase RidA (YjgF/YER057c/UK114 family)
MDDVEIDARLRELGLELPPPPTAVASYVPVRTHGNVAYVAGQVPMIDGAPVHPGRLGDPSMHVSTEQGTVAARRAALQALSSLREALGGSFERLEGIAQVTVLVAATAEFVDHPSVANGASDLLVAILGEEGRHARVAVGATSLPLGSCVEVAVTASISSGGTP